MFERFLSARCPVEDPLRDWVVWRFQWLAERFGEGIWRLPVVCPSTDDFPEKFDGTPSSLSTVVGRIALRIGVDPKRVDLQVYEKDRRQQDLMREANLDGSWSSTGAAGYYVEEGHPVDARFTVAIEASVARNPTSAVATVAHELCHALLLGGRHLTGDEEDGEPLTDLATVFFGYGIFTANALVRETSWESGGRTGWSVGRQGYLTYPVLGLALALFAANRGERRPRWGRFLRPDARAPFRQGLRYLRKQGALR